MTMIQFRNPLILATFMSSVFIAACSGSANADVESASTLPPVTGADRSVAGISTGSSTSDDSGTGYSVPAISIPNGESRLFVKFDGDEGSGIPIRNGGLVQLPEGINAEIFVDPYPTSSLTAWLDLYLEKDGVPVTDAETVILYDMWSMGHGPYTGRSDAATDGHYVFRLDYVMFGAWEQVLEIKSPGSDESARLTVIIVAVP